MHEYEVQVPGTPVTIGISKHGGGMLGKRYSGWWSYHVSSLSASYSGDDLHTSNIIGGHTHMEAAMVLSGFLAQYYDSEAPEDMSPDMATILSIFHTELSLFDYENEDA